MGRDNQLGLFSVVIPTWNEASWLPRLLTLLAREESVGEVVIADNRSLDDTRAIARSFGCVVVEGGNPAQARNAGARSARYERIVFLDADVVPRAGTLEQIVNHLRDSTVVAAHPRLRPLHAGIVLRGLYACMDLIFWILSAVGRAQGLGNCIAVQRKEFLECGGFPESVRAAEDVAFLGRIRTFGRVVYDRRACVYTSQRRFMIENRIQYVAKSLMWGGLRLLGSERSIVDYKWQVYPEEAAARDIELCRTIPDRIESKRKAGILSSYKVFYQGTLSWFRADFIRALLVAPLIVAVAVYAISNRNLLGWQDASVAKSTLEVAHRGVLVLTVAAGALGFVTMRDRVFAFIGVLAGFALFRELMGQGWSWVLYLGLFGLILFGEKRRDAIATILASRWIASLLAMCFICYFLSQLLDRAVLVSISRLILWDSSWRLPYSSNIEESLETLGGVFLLMTALGIWLAQLHRDAQPERRSPPGGYETEAVGSS
ncbi:MAG: glycosyltransferase [Gemmatimonadetes bacterium]|nr:glycosyltransferase [Gemmatimonadota bacterium]